MIKNLVILFTIAYSQSALSSHEDSFNRDLVREFLSQSEAIISSYSHDVDDLTREKNRLRILELYSNLVNFAPVSSFHDDDVQINTLTNLCFWHLIFKKSKETISKLLGSQLIWDFKQFEQNSDISMLRRSLRGKTHVPLWCYTWTTLARAMSEIGIVRGFPNDELEYSVRKLEDLAVPKDFIFSYLVMAIHLEATNRLVSSKSEFLEATAQFRIFFKENSNPSIEESGENKLGEDFDFSYFH